MKAEFKVKASSPTNDYLTESNPRKYNAFPRSCICRTAIMGCKVQPADEFAITISSQPIKGSKQYNLFKGRVGEIGYRVKNYANLLHIFTPLQEILAPFIADKSKVRIYFLAENV